MTLLLLRDGQIGQAEEEADAQKQNTVDEAARQSLPVARHVVGDEDVGNEIGDVDADGGARHSREDVLPVQVGALGRHQGKKQDAERAASARNDEQDAAGEQVESEAADASEDKATGGHGGKPDCRCEG